MNVLGFFAESDGTPSMMRLMAFLCVVIVLVVVIGNTFFGKPLDAGVILMLLSFAFGGKVLQKGQEQKPAPPEKQDTTTSGT